MSEAGGLPKDYETVKQEVLGAMQATVEEFQTWGSEIRGRAQRMPMEGSSMSETFETLIGYDFDTSGRYRERNYIKTPGELDQFMREVVAPAFVEGREVMLTDSGDNAAFHVKDKKVLFAGGANPARLEQLLTEWGMETQAGHVATPQQGIAADSWATAWRERHNVQATTRAKLVQGQQHEQEQGYGR